MSKPVQPDMWQVHADIDIQGLIKALQSDNVGIRKRAAAALRALGAKAALPQLQAAYSREQDAETRLALEMAVRTLGGAVQAAPAAEAPKPASPVTAPLAEPPANPVSSPPPVTVATPILDEDDDEEKELDDDTNPKLDQPIVSQLLERLKSDSVDEVVKAARHLGDIGDKIAVEPLILLFQNAKLSIQVRLTVAEALLKLESAPVEVALLANLRHTDWHIRRNGAAILGQLKAEWAVDPLARALRDTHPVVRRTARAALKHIGTPESRKALAQYSSSLNTDHEPMQPMTPGGQAVKRVSEIRKPPSKMLQRLGDDEDKPATIPSNKLTTQKLDTSKLRKEAPDQTADHHRPTRPLDPSVVEEMERKARENKDNPPPS